MGYRPTKINENLRQDVKRTDRIQAQREHDKIRGLYLVG